MEKKAEIINIMQKNHPCEGCSHCCEYLAMEIDKPTTIDDYDNILWYILHKDVWVYIEGNGDWYIQFNTKCEKLDDGQCLVYTHRPTICRDYSQTDCTRYGDAEAEKYMFKKAGDLFEYLAKKKPVIYKRLMKRLDLPLAESPDRPKAMRFIYSS